MTGFNSKRHAAAEKLLEEATRSCNNIDEQRALNALMRDAQPPQPAQPSEEWPGQSNIESPHNACQHRGYCKQLKSIQIELDYAKAN